MIIITLFGRSLFIGIGGGATKVRLGIEFLELELNSNSIYKYRGKKLCLGVEF
jgi:hypothetical protein